MEHCICQMQYTAYKLAHIIGRKLTEIQPSTICWIELTSDKNQAEIP